ncbi:hypothetical protein [Dehalobacter sp.]|uniref:hypothetical protein n=1 Tax=Dehalobacter sp. TaxID=1962289 RepID=UPI002585B3FB|nr:hypothetical protein [Dehalobacter sp.]MDJ0306632.1 hypothetical protein [Dehalobacter sp.]
MEKEYEELVYRLDKEFGMREYLFDIVYFYKELIPNNKKLESFLVSIFKGEKNGPNKPRLMINNVMRLVSLADDIEQIRCGKDALKIFFLVVCIETLYTIAQIDIKKHKMVIDFFEKYVIEEDRIFILDNVKRSLADYKYQVIREKDETEQEYNKRCKEELDFSFNTEITVEIFAKILSEVRNTFTHEGDYWSFSLTESDYPIQQIVKIEEQFNTGKKERIYNIKMNYGQLRQIFLKGFVNFVDKAILEENESCNIV